MIRITEEEFTDAIRDTLVQAMDAVVEALRAAPPEARASDVAERIAAGRQEMVDTLTERFAELRRQGLRR
jgi:actin-like ATPase involved in cell morphogenesis